MKNKIKQFGYALHGQVAAVCVVHSTICSNKEKEKYSSIIQL